MKRAIPYVIGIGQLQREASSVIKELSSRHDEGFIVSHNVPQAVLMSLKRYARLKAFEETKRLEEEEILKIVEAGDREFNEGKTRKAKSLKAFL